MLNSIEINAFQRVAYLKADLSRSPIHVFCGPNEAGKSSLGEAVRFVLRGLSPRVARKGAFGELIHAGKKSGHVEIDIDSFPIRRNIKDGKVSTKMSLDYPDLLVDIQLGAIEFGRCDPKELRKLLNDLFKVGTPDEFIRARLRARGVTEDMMNRTLPLIRASGFDAAAAEAKEEVSRNRGTWEGITKEKYGSVKAQSWKPEILLQPGPDQEATAQAIDDLRQMRLDRDALNRKLGAISESIRLHNEAPADDPEVLQANLDAAQGNLDGAREELEAAQAAGASRAQECREDMSRLEREIVAAKQATATLECPCCGTHLHAKTREGALILVEAKDEVVTVGPGLIELTEAATKFRDAIAQDADALRHEVKDLRARVAERQVELTAAQSLYDRGMSARAVPTANEDDAAGIAEQIADMDKKIEALQSEVQDNAEIRAAMKRAHDDLKRAAAVAASIAQWAIVAEALGSGPDGIPAELVAATTKPLNTALMQLALPMDTSPCVMGTDLSLSRADGTPYYLLSASAKWKANAMMQLALASVSTLKLVVLDGFDVIQPRDRGAFLDMLSDYAKRHPDVSIVALGTLKALPAEQIDGMSFHWLEAGQLKIVKAAA